MKLQLASIVLTFGIFNIISAQPIVFLRRHTRAAKPEFKICIPHQFLNECNDMVRAESTDHSSIICVGARDRSECLSLIQSRGADFTPVDPEDIWVAANRPDEDFKIFDEIRTKEEPNNEFRYEGVAVIHADQEISKIADIKGFKSCHTGIGRNVGYKIPLTKLRTMGIIGDLNDQQISPRENELKALSTLFSKACIVGKWSADPEINKKLKEKYPNLCSLCEKPNVCDYPDNFSGYDGALRCLAHNGGQIAWTKVYYVKKFFGMPIGTESKTTETGNDPSKYMYLCPDGTKQPVVNNTPCIWAARPWQGFITNDDHVSAIGILHKKLKELIKLGEETESQWLGDVLTLNNKTHIRETDLLSPKQYLDKANYTDVIERDYGPPKKYVRFCVLSDLEKKKCMEFSQMAFSRTIRPQFGCVQRGKLEECLKAVRDNEADIMTLDADEIDLAKREYSLKPIVSEVGNGEGNDGSYYSVAVVRKGTPYQSFADLRGTRSCHPNYKNTAGYTAPLYTLVKQGLISQKNCSYIKGLSDFFVGGSCIPGARELGQPNFCQNCVGKIDDKEAVNFKCIADSSEAFFDYAGAVRCLAANHGDVAFVTHQSVIENSDGNNKDKWAIELKSQDFELLCPTGGRKPVQAYAECNLAKIPPHMVVTNNAKNDPEIEEIRHALVEAGQLFGKRSDLFKLFGSYNGKKDLLFKDTAASLVSTDNETQLMQDYEKMLADIRACGQSGHQ